MNDSEAACFGAEFEALEYHCSDCGFGRLAVRPVNSDVDIFIRILFYLNKKSREDARKFSRPRHGLVNTKTTTGTSEAWSIFFFFWGGGGGREGASEPKWQWLGLFCGLRLKSICVRCKNKHTVAKSLSLAKRGWLVGESIEEWLRNGRSKLADASPVTTPTETTVTRANLRASFEVNLCPILNRNTPLNTVAKAL